MHEQPYVDRYIHLINNTNRPEHAAVYLSINHSPISAREDSPGGVENLGQRTERTLGMRGRGSGGGQNEPPEIHQPYREYRAEIAPRAEDYLVHIARRAAVCRLKHHLSW